MTDKVKKVRKKKSAEPIESFEDPQPALTPEASAEISEAMEAPKQLTPHEQAEMLRNYVSSMEKTQGLSNENVRDLLDTVYRRFLLVLNYSPLSKEAGMKDLRIELKRTFEDEISRYSDEEAK